jgi:cobaltochelatase CobT
LLHIVYRAADDPELGVPNLDAISRRDLLKENVDGEAVEWAFTRLMANPRSNKYLVVLSDGAPVDDSTIAANGYDEGLLPWHLETVLDKIARSGNMSVLGIGLGYRPSHAYPHVREVSPAEDLITVTLEAVADLLEASSSSSHRDEKWD